jgi:hypothetical protein
MKKFLVICTMIFLFCTGFIYSQQSVTVNVPGSSYYIHYDGGSGYGQASGLKAGKSGHTYRSFIHWSNIRYFIPQNSQIQNVEFSISWSGSTSAQLEYRNFTWSQYIPERYANIAGGTLWGSVSASETVYSFSGLKELVQNIVNGTGNNEFRMGIKNQNESDISYYVSYLFDVSLKVTYLASKVTVNQVDKEGDSFGQVGRWMNNDWSYFGVPFNFDLPNNSEVYLLSDQNFKPGTYQKSQPFQSTDNNKLSNP